VLLIKNKAQAAVEFLMTYGWVILVFLLVIAALVYLGVLNPDMLLPDKCVLSAGITCVDFEVEASRVVVILQNSFTESITINSVEMRDKNSGFSCFNSVGKEVKTDEKESFVILGCNNGDTGRKLNGELLVTFTKKVSGLPHVAQGSIISRVSGSSTSSSDICQNAESSGLCEGLDIVFGEGYMASCCSNYELCC